MSSVSREVTPANDASSSAGSPILVPSDTALATSLDTDADIAAMILSDTEDSPQHGASSSAVDPALDPSTQHTPTEDRPAQGPTPEIASHLILPADMDTPPTSRASGDVPPPTVRSRSSSMDVDSPSPSPEIEPAWFARFRHRTLTGLSSCSSNPRRYIESTS